MNSVVETRLTGQCPRCAVLSTEDAAKVDLPVVDSGLPLTCRWPHFCQSHIHKMSITKVKNSYRRVGRVANGAPSISSGLRTLR